jgi:hypothetical protein
MGKLRALPARLTTAPPRIAAAPVTASSGFVRRDGRSSTARGYGADWRRVRLAVLASEPLCRICEAVGRVTAATEVDHIEPFQGIEDPLRLAVANLRPLCRPCHLARTARQATGGGQGVQGGGASISGQSTGRDRVPPHAEVFSGGE